MLKLTLWHFVKEIIYPGPFTYENHNYCVLDLGGLEFNYKGDCVYWRWPWCRKTTEGKPYLCITLWSCFNTLDEIDKWNKEFWDIAHLHSEFWERYKESAMYRGDFEPSWWERDFRGE